MVLQAVTMCSDMVGYQLFRVPCCLHLQGEVSRAWNWTQKQDRKYKTE